MNIVLKLHEGPYILSAIGAVDFTVALAWHGSLAILLTGSCIRAFDWYQNQRPWMTLNGHYALRLEIHALSEPTTKI